MICHIYMLNKIAVVRAMGDGVLPMANVEKKNIQSQAVGADKPLKLPFEFYTQYCDPCVCVWWCFFYVGMRVASRG